MNRPRLLGCRAKESDGNNREIKKNGVGVIFISHNLNDIFQVSDRILVLRRGEKVGERLISQTNHDEVVHLWWRVKGSLGEWSSTANLASGISLAAA